MLRGAHSSPVRRPHAKSPCEQPSAMSAIRTMTDRSLCDERTSVLCSPNGRVLKEVHCLGAVHWNQRRVHESEEHRWGCRRCNERAAHLDVVHLGNAIGRLAKRGSTACVHGSSEFGRVFFLEEQDAITWSDEQMVFGGTQIVFQVCSRLLSTAEGAGHNSTFQLRRSLREAAEWSMHPVTAETVGWLRVHVDDLQRLVFVDEVQSDVVEHLLARAAEGDVAAQMLARELTDWQVNGFASVRHWAAAIGYRVAMLSEESVAAIAAKTKSARKWNVYYGALIKRLGLARHACAEYPGAIFIDD